MDRTVSLLITLACLSACDARVRGPGGAFDLDLGLNAFGEPAVDLTDATLTVSLGDDAWPLGTPEDDGSWVWDEVPVLRDERLELSWSRSDHLVAHARTSPLFASSGTLSAEAWVLPLEQPATESVLTPLIAPFGLSMAVLGSGDVVWTGGAGDVVGDRGRAVPGTASFWRMDRAAPAPFPRLIANRIGADGAVDPRVFATLSPIRLDGDEALLLAGGQRDATDNSPLDDVLMLDPATGDPIGTMRMDVPRSLHHAVVLDPGRVLMVGGDAVLASWEVLDVGRRTSTGAVSLDDLGGWGAACADHPDGSVSCCGGAVPDPLSDDLVSTKGCHHVDPDAEPSMARLPDLPVPLTGAAMVALDDGTLLISGGTTGTVAPDRLGVARNNAYALDPDAKAWRAVGRMASARVHHAMVPLTDRRALVVGGVDASGGRSPQRLGTGAGAPEILDLQDGTTRVLDRTAALTGAWPAVVDVPGDLAVFVEGAHFVDGRTRGGRSLGLIGRPTAP